MLNINITKEQHAALDQALQAIYVADGEGYSLDADIGALKRAKEHESAQRKALGAENAQLKTRLATLEAIDIDKVKGEVFGQFAEKYVQGEAKRIAERLAGSENADKLLPYIMPRLKVNPDMSVVGHDANGKAFEHIDNFIDSFLTDAVFSGIVKKPSKGSAITQAASVPVERKPLSKMTNRELSDHIKTLKGGK